MMKPDLPFVARKPEEHEIQDYCAAEGWNVENAQVVRKTKRRLVEDQENAWRTANKNADALADPLQHQIKKRFITS
jgi:hypothetical protein